MPDIEALKLSVVINVVSGDARDPLLNDLADVLAADALGNALDDGLRCMAWVSTPARGDDGSHMDRIAAQRGLRRHRSDEGDGMTGFREVRCLLLLAVPVVLLVAGCSGNTTGPTNVTSDSALLHSRLKCDGTERGYYAHQYRVVGTSTWSAQPAQGPIQCQGAGDYIPLEYDTGHTLSPSTQYEYRIAVDTDTDFSNAGWWDKNGNSNGTSYDTFTTPPPSTDSTVIAVGGDVACGTTEANYNGGSGTATACHMGQTSNLVVAMAPQRVFALGDLQYNSGALSDFNVSYQNSWGRFKDQTNPVVGNHEYGTTNAGGYFTYFGTAAAPSDGYYSFDVTVGASKWHIAVINSECTRIGGGVGCAVGSPQYNWLNADLTSNDNTQCTAVLTHRPRWSSSSFASPDIQPLVDVMGAHKVDLLLAGHAHSYERFAPQDAAGQAAATGIREIVVGTGGRDFQGLGTGEPNSLIRKTNIFGVMKLTLHPTGYDWEFVPDPATPFADSGTGSCN